MKTIYLLLFALLISSCMNEAQQKVQLNNSEIKLELLFEHDGCKVYRFLDGHYVYWCDCSGQVKSEYTTRSGKTSIHHDQYQITTK